MRRHRYQLSLAVASVTAMLAATPAMPESWTVDGLFSQAFSARNRRADDGESNRGTSTTRLGVTVATRSDTMLFSVSPAVSLSGETADGDSDSTFEVNPSLVSNFNYTAPLTRVSGRFSVIPEFVDSRDIDDLFFEDPLTGETRQISTTRNVDALEINIRGNLDASRQLTPLTSLNGGVFFNIREYDETTDDLQPNRSVGARLGLSRSLDPRTTAGISGASRFFTSDDPDDDESITHTLSLSGSRQLTERHRVNASLGTTLVNQSDDFETRFTGSLGFSYRTPRTTYRLSASSGVQQNQDGGLVNSVRLGGTASHQINTLQSISLATTLVTDTPLDDGGEDEVRLVVAPQYRIRLTADWSLSLGYSFDARRDNDDELILDNRISLSFSRNFDLFR